MNSVSIRDMQNYVETMGSNNQSDNDFGNIIELGAEDLGNDFGASLLSNTRINARPATNTSNTQSVSAFEPIHNIQVGSMEPLDAISIDIPMGAPPAMEFSVNPSKSTSFSSSSGGGISFDDLPTGNSNMFNNTILKVSGKR